MVNLKRQKGNNEKQDMWEMIDEIEEKYVDLIEELEGESPYHHPQMRVTGASVREIPRLQKKRREKK
jgi:hypothetical protein